MTMVPSESGNKQKSTRDYVFYSNNSAMNQVIEGGYNNNNNYYYNYLLGSSDHQFVVRHMAEEEDSSSRSVPNNNNNNTSTTTHHNNNNEPEAEAEAVSTSLKEEEEQGGGNNNNNMSNWLQLSIGFHHQSQTHSAVTTTKHHYPPPTSGLELELLPPTNWASSPRPNSEAVTPAPRGCSSSSAAASSNLVFEQTTSSSTSSMPMPMPSGPTSLLGQQQQLLPQWAFGPLLPHSMPLIMPPSSSPSSYSSQYSCSSLRPPNFPLGPTFNYPHPHPHPHALPPFHYFAPSSSSSSGFNINDQFVDVAGPSSQSHHATATLRVVDPPRRPHSGIWFMLQASLNQAREPFLPQIPKNYLRIKDGRMTVRLLLKYLVSKLKLESESEIEITCRGQQLLPFLTLQHVRDNIWTPRDNTTTRPLLSDSSTTDHVMVLHYGRSTC